MNLVKGHEITQIRGSKQYKCIVTLNDLPLIVNRWGGLCNDPSWWVILKFLPSRTTNQQSDTRINLGELYVSFKEGSIQRGVFFKTPKMPKGLGGDVFFSREK